MPDDETVKKGGYVYFLTNPAIPGHVKIGKSTRPPEERARQLFTTAVPRPYKVVAFQRFDDEETLLRAERELHAKYAARRVPNREFLKLTLQWSRRKRCCWSCRSA